jgi:hypothetical protein
MNIDEMLFCHKALLKALKISIFSVNNSVWHEIFTGGTTPGYSDWTENCPLGIPDDLANRRVRDPYARWCESLSLSAFADGAGYSISNWVLIFVCQIYSSLSF